MRDKWRNFGLGVIRKLIALDWGLQDEGTELTATEAEAPTADARGSVQEIISLSLSRCLLWRGRRIACYSGHAAVGRERETT